MNQDAAMTQMDWHDKRVAIDRMRQQGAIITTMESLLFELLRVAGTDTFKSISAIVK